MPRTRAFETALHIVCSNCDEVLAIDSPVDRYFEDVAVTCSCGKPVDLWAAAIHTLHEWKHLFGLQLVGARHTLISGLPLEPDQPLVLRFSEHGISEDARILNVSYTPIGSGGMFPIEMHSNQPIRHLIPNTLLLYPMPPKGGPKGTTKLNVSVTWIEASKSVSWQSLADAVNAFTQDRPADAILPANVAVEIRLNELMSVVLRQVAASDPVKAFLQDAASYSHQLNVLLPLVARLLNVPMLSDDIRGSLNRLRKMRNDVAHRGEPSTRLDNKFEVAKLLAAALFGFRYVDRLAMSAANRHEAV